MSEERSVSIIIPVLNEEENVKKLNRNLKALQQAHEVIFVDGGSRDNTAGLIDKDFRLIVSPEKGRSFQMNYGAAAANGDVLLFLHADSLLPSDAIDCIRRVMENGYKVGCFNLSFDSVSVLMKICAFLSNARVKLRNIAFGDQGIFIERNLFNSIGGFPSLPLMEDYKLSMILSGRGCRFGVAAGKIVTSERRFLKHGRLRTMWKMQKLQHMFRKGIDISRIARLYNE